LRGIKAFRRAYWIFYRLSGGAPGVSVGSVPILSPLPNIATHIVQSVAILREGIDGRKCFEAILFGVLFGKRSLPNISHPFSLGFEFVAPGEFFASQAATSSVLKLRLCRQIFLGPLAVSQCIFVSDVHNR